MWLEDTVGLKARAWHDRFVIRDIIDLHAVAGTFCYADLENLARRHDPDLDLEAIRDHLASLRTLPMIRPQMTYDECVRYEVCGYRLHNLSFRAKRR